MTIKDKIIQCPASCLASFGEVFNGQYDHSMIDPAFRREAVYTPIIVDIGANVGAFSIWAKRRWPRAIVHAYEPNPEIYPFLSNNLSDIAETYPFAVTSRETPTLWIGNDTPLCSSITPWDRANKTSVPVQSCHPKHVPKCDILKLDCEGSEADILANLDFLPVYLAMEWHSDVLRVKCENLLCERMKLIESTVLGDGYGMMKFLRFKF